MKEKKLKKIKENYEKYVDEKEVRVFEFVTKWNRDNYLVSKFGQIISQEYTDYFKDRVEIFIHDEYYIVVGEVEDKELRAVGRKICQHMSAGRLCKRYGKSTQLFHCIRKF